jgi:aromatic-L-amino-acid decarboxylase
MEPMATERTALAAAASELLNGAEQRLASSGPITGVGVEWVVGAQAGSAQPSALHSAAKHKLGLQSSPVGLDRALAELVDTSAAGTQDRHGGYFAYAPTGGLYSSALASYACAAMSRGLTWLPTSPELAAIEQAAIDWMGAEVCRWAPAEASGGVFTSGGACKPCRPHPSPLPSP